MCPLFNVIFKYIYVRSYIYMSEKNRLQSEDSIESIDVGTGGYLGHLAPKILQKSIELPLLCSENAPF